MIARVALPVVALLVFGGSVLPAQGSTAVPGHLADSSMQFLAPLIGRWRPVLPDSIRARIGYDPVAGDYSWTVGRHAIRLREGYPVGVSADSAQLDGLIHWDPATEKVAFTFVAGRGPGQGRLFRGEYRRRADGVIEREYDVFYRSLADVPGESLGGLRRRYRETFTFVGRDTVRTTLEWWNAGAWRPFGTFAGGMQVRIRP